MRLIASAFGLLLLTAPASSLARGRSSGSTFRELEAQMRLAYERTHPCPATGRVFGSCPGYVIYYLPPSRRVESSGDPWQMQWMTVEEEKASRAEWIEERGRAP